MKVHVTATSNAPLPRARSLLAGLRGAEDRLYHRQRGLRHPFAIYNLSFMKVIRRLANVLDELNGVAGRREYDDPQKYRWDDRLLLEQDHILDALMEHFDDSKAVLLSFVATNRDPAFRRAWKHFVAETREYRSLVGAVVNRLKHNQRHIASIFYRGREFDPGYYIVAPDHDGVLGPDPELHEGGRTAFSFARDLRYHVCGLYAMGEAVATGIACFGDFADAPQDVPEAKAALVMQTLQRVSLLPLRFFPDEVQQPVPLVHGGGSLNCPEISIDYPATRANVRQANVQRGTVSFGEGDEYSLNYAYPYAGPARKPASGVRDEENDSEE